MTGDHDNNVYNRGVRWKNANGRYSSSYG
jgi:hypothetical protein